MTECVGIAWYWPDLGWGYRDRVRGPDSGEISEVSPFAEGTDAVVKREKSLQCFPEASRNTYKALH